MKHLSQTITEQARTTPVIYEADLCVIGGSCTGVFAAIRAARLGLRVAIIEGHNCFGGVATNAMVNIWHSLYDTDGSQQIIAGLTEEMINRLKRRKAVTVRDGVNAGHSPQYFILNTEELKIELDEIVAEHQIKPFFHTLFVAPHVDDGALKGVVVENKDGRGVILAKAFVDATGDGDLAARLGLETYYANHLQPGTTCAKIARWSDVGKQQIDIKKLYSDHKKEFGLPETFIWGAALPGDIDVHMLAASRISMNMSKASELTAAEIEGRRQVRAIMDMLREHIPEADPVLVQLPARIGVRETRHVRCLHSLEGEKIMSGGRHPDAIANGTYPSDLHHTDKSGITFRHLDGNQRISRPGQETETSRWREAFPEEPKYYQISYRSMVPAGNVYPNLIVAGRMIDSDEMAHAAIRVMVNMNQTGEAAGVAAYLALQADQSFSEVDPVLLRKTLKEGGSAIV